MPQIIETNINLNKFGTEFQKILINQIITNLKANENEPHFGENVINEIQPQMFDLTSAKEIIYVIKKFYNKRGKMPNGFIAVKYLITAEPFKTQQKNRVLRRLDDIESVCTGINHSVRESFQTFVDIAVVDEMMKVLKQAKSDGDISKVNEIGEISRALVKRRESVLYKINDFFDASESVFQEENNVQLTTFLGDEFDEFLGGGFRYGFNYTFVIPKNTGKTTTVVQVAANWVVKLKRKVIVFYWEDTLNDLVAKGVSSLCKIPIQNIKKKNYKLSKEYQEFQKLKTENYGNLKMVGLSHGATIDDVINVVYELVEQGFDPDMIVLDYYSKLSPRRGKRYDNNYEYLGEAAIMLTDLIKEDNLNCVGLFFQQSGRDAMGKEFAMVNSVRGDIAILHPAHCALIFTQTPEMREKKCINVSFENMRNQNAGKGIKNMYFNGSEMEFGGSAASPDWETRDIEYWKRKGVVL